MTNAQYPDLPEPQGPYGSSTDGYGAVQPPMRAMPSPERALPPARAPYAPSRKGTSTLAGILGYAALALACLVLATATFLFVADPAQILRDQITIRIKAATGRTLTIAGATRLSLYPSLGLTMRDVTLSAPPGMDGGPSVKMARLTASLQLLPLLKKRAVVERLILTRPQINL
ncbi:MAG TPA: AsmA family protein, partial [Rhizobiales bacterium]|nr:AsmA family protein [Hyphomicrobiales bacterium]